MDIWALRALSLTVNLRAHGVPVTVTRPAPDNTPVETTGIWLAPLNDDRPVGGDFSRRDPRRLMALPITSALPSAPRGTVIAAREIGATVTANWRVDGYDDRIDPDVMRVILLRES